jgi:hypothetical protein
MRGNIPFVCQGRKEPFISISGDKTCGNGVLGGSEHDGVPSATVARVGEPDAPYVRCVLQVWFN